MDLQKQFEQDKASKMFADKYIDELENLIISINKESRKKGKKRNRKKKRKVAR